MQNSAKLGKNSRNEITYKLVNVLIESPDLSDDQLGLKLGISRNTIAKYRKSNEVQDLIKEKLTIPITEYQRLCFKAFKRLEIHLDDPDPRLSLAAIKVLMQSLPASYHDNQTQMDDDLVTFSRKEIEEHRLRIDAVQKFQKEPISWEELENGEFNIIDQDKTPWRDK